MQPAKPARRAALVPIDRRLLVSSAPAGSGPLVALGDASYSLYLSQVPVIAVVGLVWRRLAAEPPPGLHVTRAGVAGAVGGVIEVPLLRASRRLARVAMSAPIR